MDQHDLTHDLPDGLRAGLRRGAEHLWLVEGLDRGFTLTQAAQLLASPPLRREFDLAARTMAPGPDFVAAAAQASEAGRLNRALLRQAMAARGQLADPETASRLELGGWLKRWHPGTGDPARPFSEALLSLELAVAEWEAEGAVADAALSSASVEALAGRVAAWSGWRRALADDVVAAAVRALSAGGRGDDAPTADDPFAVGSRAQFALAASGQGDAPTAVLSGAVILPPHHLPARSVAPEAAGVWHLTDDGDVVVDVKVSVGDRPVEALTGHVAADGRLQTLPLPRSGPVYRGTLELDAFPDHITVYATGGGAPGTEEEAAAVQGFVAAILSRRADERARWDGLARPPVGRADRPFLCELVAAGEVPWG